MREKELVKIETLIEQNKIDEAQFELSNLGEKYNKNGNYLYLRGKVFYLKKLYYAAIDALLISLEFEQNDRIYNLISEIYGVLGNHDLKKIFLNTNLRLSAIETLKDQLTGIYRK